MQVTRQQILEILKDRREATVDEVVQDLRNLRGDSITPVTVRHHLGILQEEGLVDTPQTRHRSSPGRPRHIYTLTQHGISHFPNNYQHLAENLLKQMEARLSPEHTNVIIEGVADSMAQEASIPDGTIHERLDAVIHYLNNNSYEASWEPVDGGYMLHMKNCPYHALTHDNDRLCHMDMRLISSMLGVVPRLTSRVAKGDETCSYFIPHSAL